MKPGDRKTDAECDQLQIEDEAEAWDAVTRLVKVPIAPEMHAALSGFVFKVGSTQLARSTLLRKLNARDYAGACDELRNWIYANKQVMRGWSTGAAMSGGSVSRGSEMAFTVLGPVAAEVGG